MSYTSHECFASYMIVLVSSKEIHSNKCQLSEIYLSNGSGIHITIHGFSKFDVTKNGGSRDSQGLENLHIFFSRFVAVIRSFAACARLSQLYEGAV